MSMSTMQPKQDAATAFNPQRGSKMDIEDAAISEVYLFNVWAEVSM